MSRREDRREGCTSLWEGGHRESEIAKNYAADTGNTEKNAWRQQRRVGAVDGDDAVVDDGGEAHRKKDICDGRRTVPAKAAEVPFQDEEGADAGGAEAAGRRAEVPRGNSLGLCSEEVGCNFGFQRVQQTGHQVLHRALRGVSLLRDLLLPEALWKPSGGGRLEEAAGLRRRAQRIPEAPDQRLVGRLAQDEGHAEAQSVLRAKRAI